MNVFRLTLLFYLAVFARRVNAVVITKADEAEKLGLVNSGTGDKSDKTAESEGSSERRLRRQLFQRYTWVQGSDFTECSVTCGFGLRSRVVTCYDYVTQTFVSDSICEQSGVENLEPEVAECDQGPCPGGYVYNVTAWQECNVTCADGGFQVREVYCTEQSSGQLMNGTHCEGAQLVRPAALRPCQNFSLCYLHEYEVGNWSQCSVTCGRDGYQRRNVSCLDIETGIERPDAYCGEEGLLKPESHRLCSNTSDCVFNNYSYETDEWSQCNVICGTEGFQVRDVYCMELLTGQLVNDTECENVLLVKPETQRPCQNFSLCYLYKYEVGNWSQCNVTCGSEGFQVRDAYCMELLTGQLVNETECENALLVKPETQRLCQNFSLCYLHTYEVGDWSQCSVTCGTSGYEDRNVSCVEVNTGITKSDTHCEEEGLVKPESNRSCQNMSDCVFNMYYYETSEWSQCSVTCGQGNMTRTVKCVNELTGVRVGDSFCAAEVKPNTSQPCQQQECVPDPVYYDYVTGSWRPCDCITGIQWRPFHCVQLGSENLEIMNSSHCESQSIPHPTTVRECPADECPGIWRVTEWSDCSVTCGNGTRQRHSYCVLQTNERILLDARNCNSTAAPLLAESCIIEQCATRYHWLPDQWGQCNGTCGLAYQARRVACYSVFEGVVEEANEALCDDNDRPTDLQACELDFCNGVWETGPWSECSKTCGGGFQIRYVNCRPENSSVPAKCDENSRPHESQECNMTACTQPALPCDSTPCQNGGTCVDEDDSYSCVCTPDFYGLNCDLERDCSANPCQNDGVCRVVDASIQCECTSGWSGLMCQQDVENPVLHVCPSDITLNAATGRATATANWNAPFASDNSGKVKVTSSYRSGAPFTIGETEVVYTATDPAGNTGNCSFTVVVRDVQKPVFADCPDDMVRGIVTPDGEVRAQWTPPTATDNSGKFGLSWSREPPDFFPVGVHRVIYTATDPSGNKQFCSFDISVEPLRDFTEDQLLRFEITLDVEFTVALTDRSSREFATVAAAVEDAVAVLIHLGNIEGFHMVVVTDFRRGSIVADMVLVFEEPANDVVRYKSLEAIYSDVNSGRIGDYAAKQLSAVSPTGEKIEVNWCNIKPCPDHMNCTLLPDKCVAHCANNEHYCQNGGRCEVSVPDNLIRCICTSNYYGIRCEIPDIVNDAEAVTIMAALVWVGLLGSVVILFSITKLRRCCCRDRFQRPNFLRKDFFRDISARDSPEDEEIVKAEKLPPENGVTEDVETMLSQSNFSLAHTDATENVQHRVDLTEAEDYL